MVLGDAALNGAVEEATQTSGTADGKERSERDAFTVKTGLAQMLKGGVIMDVVNAEQVCPCRRDRFIATPTAKSFCLSFS